MFLPYWQTDRCQRAAACGASGEPRPAVTWMQDGARRLISAACARAESLGIRRGMRLAQAQAMLPGLAMRRATPDADADALSALAGWCRRFTPLSRAEPPDGIWLDLSGCAHLFGGEEDLLRDLSARLRRSGLDARIAVAETPGAAFAVARFAGTGLAGARTARGKPARARPVSAEPAHSEPVNAGFASTGPASAGPVRVKPARSGPVNTGPDSAGPASARRISTGPVGAPPANAAFMRTDPAGAADTGFDQDRFVATRFAIVSVPPGGLDRALSPLPVASLRLTLDQQTLLHRFGLRRIGMLETLPRGPLTRRLGAEVLLRLDQAFGRVFEPVCPDLPLAALQERLAFTEPLQTPDSLLAANALLSRRLCRTLQDLCLGARQLELVFVRLDGSTCTQTVTLALPSNVARHVGRLLDERLDQIDPGEGVEVIWLRARIVEPIDRTQDTMRALSPDLAGTTQALSELAPLIDALWLRLGRHRLWRPSAVESDVPERSVARAAPLSTEPGGWPPFLPRPVRLVDPPQPVRAMAALPDHPPLWFVWRAHRHVVRRADGPERIAGEWWRRSGELTALRDYFRVEDEQGRRFWLFRRGDGEHPGTGDLGWFLHGLF